LLNGDLKMVTDFLAFFMSGTSIFFRGRVPRFNYFLPVLAAIGALAGKGTVSPTQYPGRL
jgi:hypothetical protein